MPITSKKCRLIYFPVPKAACTTAKHVFWNLDHKSAQARLKLSLGRKKWARDAGIAKRLRGIHLRRGYETVPYPHGFRTPARYDTVAIIRDPALRLRSAWSNKVDTAGFARWRQEPLAEQAGLPTNPDFSTFVRNYQTYCEISRSTRMHTRPFSLYLGDLAAIDHLFKLEDIPQFFALLSARSGTDVSPSHQNSAQPEKRDGSVTVGDIDLLRQITAKEYKYLRGAYDFDEAAERLLQ